MQLDVRDILIEAVGFNRAYKITGEQPHLETAQLTEPIEGEITISRLESGLLVRGRITTAVELECHRCLSTFSCPVNVRFKQVFAEEPGDDEFPIENRAIDLAPLIEQEVILSLPIKILCRPDCPGIQPPAESN